MAFLSDELLAAQLQIARANDEKERLRLKCNPKFVKKTDDFDTTMYDILESWLDRELATDGNIITAKKWEILHTSSRP